MIAADISPIDVLSHLPILCEDKNVPYIYVKSRAEVGEACKTKRPTSCVLITLPDKSAKVKKSFDRCLELVKAKNKYVDWTMSRKWMIAEVEEILIQRKLVSASNILFIPY